MIHLVVRNSWPLVPILIHASTPGFFSFCLRSVLLLSCHVRQSITSFSGFPTEILHGFWCSRPLAACFVLMNLLIFCETYKLRSVIVLHPPSVLRLVLNTVLYLYSMHPSTLVIIVRQDFLMRKRLF
jgi:hypothetical protein